MMQLNAQSLVFEFSEAVLVVHVSTLIIRAANPRCEEALGYCQSEMVGAELGLLLSKECSKKVSVITPGTLMEQPGLHEEIPLMRKDGTIFIASVHVIRTEDGGEMVGILFLRDMSERRKLERELITKHMALKKAYEKIQLANQNLEHANAEIRAAQQSLVHLEKMATIGRFASGVAHEVNNPMAFVLENINRLQDYSVHLLPLMERQLEDPRQDPAIRTQLDEIVSELPVIISESLTGAQRVRDIVQQLNSFSNVKDQEAQWTDLKEVIESSVMMVKKQIKHIARLEQHYYDIPKVVCVPGQIGLGLVNILVNSIHAISEGDTKQNFILLKTRPQGKSVVVEVQDTGCGISPEHLEHVLDPFFTTKPSGKGTGLGLAISANIIQLHGGEIAVESVVGQGTTVRVTLPIKGTMEVPAAPTRVVRATLSKARLKILLVDDELFLLRALDRSLRRHHDVLLATTGQEALEFLEEHEDIDLIITDLMMPDMDGIKLYELIIAKHPHLQNQVVFMTGGVFTNDVRNFLTNSSLEVLNKPIDRQKLDQVIAKVTTH